MEDAMEAALVEIIEVVPPKQFGSTIDGVEVLKKSL